MGRGKIEIKRIENSTNRQVTYSKRRAGILKKAKELTVLCDAEVSLLMFSSTGKLHEFVSPSTTTKKVYDRYQQTSGISLWQSHYERMQDNLNKLKEINRKLRREIRQRNGEDLDGLTFQQLCTLEQNMDKSAECVRNRKLTKQDFINCVKQFHVIGTQTDTYKKKVKNHEETQNDLLREMQRREAEYHYAFGDQEGDYPSAAGLAAANGNAAHIFAFRLQPSQPNLHLQDDASGYGSYGLSLA